MLRTAFHKSLLIILFSISCICCQAEPNEAGQEQAVIDWAKQNAITLESVSPNGSMSDLGKLQEVIGDSRIVLLGDSRHDAREQWLLKHRVIEFLVTEMGFSVLALEESLPCTSPINACLREEQQNMGKALGEMGSSYIWNTQEMLDLMNSLVDHNKSVTQEDRVQVFGFDISDGARMGVDNVLEYLNGIKPEAARSLSQQIDLSPFSENIWFESFANFGRMTPESIETLEYGLDHLVEYLRREKEDLISNSEPLEYEWALRQAIVATQAFDLMVLGSQNDFIGAGSSRERAMAENLAWLLETAVPDRKVIVWAHNFHVAKGKQNISMPNRPPVDDMEPLGFLLEQTIDDSVFSIGFSFDQGGDSSDLSATPDGWVDNLLSQAGPDAMFLDLRSSDGRGPVHQWLNAPQTMRGEGGGVVLIPARAFDAIVFVRELTRTKRFQ